MVRMKEKLFGWVVRHRKPIIAFYAVVALVCLFLRQFVGVNYDITSYLPDEAASTVALNTMGDEFDGDIPNCRVMVPNVSIAEALKYKKKIAKVDGVEEVLWLDDSADIDQPLETQDTDTVETYYKDSTALFNVTIDTEKQIAATDAIRQIVGDEGAITGSAMSNALATTSTESQISIITAAAIAIIFLILVITTNSWAEPVMVLLGLGVSVFINWGTNLIFGEISFVTNSAGSILQVAIALDFSVFLLHRFNEERGKHGSVEQDMIKSCCMSSVAVFSSGCTVCIGFIALAAMQFKIGPDLGLALAKGIAISLVSVFSFTPSMFVQFDNFVQKTQHKPFIPPLGKFARLVLTVCIPAAVVILAVVYPARTASTSTDITYYYGTSHIFGTDTQLGQDMEKVKKVFGNSDTYVVLVPRGEVSQEQALSDALKELPEVKSIQSYVDVASPYIPSGMAEKSTLDLVESENYSRLVLTVTVPYEGSSTFKTVKKIRKIANKYYPGKAMLAGEGVSTTDLKDTITVDKDKVDLIAVVAVFVVLLIATKSISLPIILVLVIETSIWLNFAAPLYTGMNEFFLAYLIVSSIQLGVAVDYGILIADRYREDRVTMHKREAMLETIEACTIPVLTSGSVLLICGFLIHAISSHGVLKQIGWFLGVGVSISLVAVLFALPGFLYVLDGVIGKTTLHSNFLPKDAEAPAVSGAGNAAVAPAATVNAAASVDAQPAQAGAQAQ